MWYCRNKLFDRYGILNDEWLVTTKSQRINLTITRVSMKIWRNSYEIGDPHWLTVLLLNHMGEYKSKGYPPVTIDYLEYIDAENGYADYFELPVNDTIVFKL